MKNQNFEIKNPEGLYDPKPHGYSHMATVNSNSKMVFIAGQGGSNMDGVLSDDFKEEKLQILNNVKSMYMDQIDDPNFREHFSLINNS